MVLQQISPTSYTYGKGAGLAGFQVPIYNRLLVYEFGLYRVPASSISTTATEINIYAKKTAIVIQLHTGGLMVLL